MEAKRPEVIIDLERYNELLDIEKRDRKEEGTKIIEIFTETLSLSRNLPDFSLNILISLLNKEADKRGYYFGLTDHMGGQGSSRKVIFKKKEEE